MYKNILFLIVCVILAGMVPCMAHAAQEVKFGATLCDENEMRIGNVCMPIETVGCPENFYRTFIDQATFSAATVGTDSANCMNTYNVQDLDDNIVLLYNGVLVNFGPGTCGDGERYIGGACVSLARGDCPENMRDITASADGVVPPVSGVCPSGYATFAMGANCASGDRFGGLCGVLCDGDLRYAGSGACSAMCDDVHVIRTSTGVALPIYATKQTTPSINIQTPNGNVCYVNMVQGNASGTINMRYNNKSYYAID